MRNGRSLPRGGAASCRRGFTLVELLVVIAILALLISMLLPSLRRAKGIARTMKCSANLHGIGKAAAMYQAHNDGYVPRDYWYNNDRPNTFDYAHYLFAGKLSQYVGGPEIPGLYNDDDEYMYEVFKHIDIYRCPSVDEPEFVLTYIVNGIDFEYYASDGEYTSGPPSQVEDLPTAAAEIAYVVEANIQYLDPRRFGYYDVLYRSSLPFHGVVPNPDSRMIRYDDMRHDGRTTVVFFDGHAGPRHLTPQDLPIQLFNPLDTTYAE